MFSQIYFKTIFYVAGGLDTACTTTKMKQNCIEFFPVKIFVGFIKHQSRHESISYSCKIHF